MTGNVNCEFPLLSGSWTASTTAEGGMLALLVSRAVALASHVLFLVILVLIAEGLARVAVQKARAVTRCVAKVFQVLLLAKAKRKEAVGCKRLPPGLSKRSKKQQGKARASTGGKRSEALPARAAPASRPAAYPPASAVHLSQVLERQQNCLVCSRCLPAAACTWWQAQCGLSARTVRLLAAILEFSRLS